MPSVLPLTAAPWYGADAWVRQIIGIHCDPATGSAYWLEKQAALGFDARDVVGGVADLHRFGPMYPAELRSRPVFDFVPAACRQDLTRLRIVESGGTTGAPTRTVYGRDEFDFAFAAVFAHAARAAGWPEGAHWLACVPGAPHLISDAARRMAHAMESPEPFTIDLDPRWIKKTTPGSPVFEAYMEHLVDQAMDVIRSQPVDALFITPKLIVPLAERMTDAQRDRIRAIHLGGLAIEAPLVHALGADYFPRALFLAGYGNSLLGLLMEVEATAGPHMDYFFPGPRLLLSVMPADDRPPEERFREAVVPEASGQLVAHRLDATFMLLNLVERDRVTAISASAAARALGWEGNGVRDPHVPAALAESVRTGVY